MLGDPTVADGEGPVGQSVQREPVVGCDHDGPGEPVEVVLEHGQRVEVEVVGGLVEQQDVRSGDEQVQERDPPPLAAGQPPDLGALEGPVEPEPLGELAGGQGRPVGERDVRGDVQDAVEHRPVEVEAGPAGLGVDAELHRRADLEDALVGGKITGQRVQQRGLAGAVRTDDPDALAGSDAEVDAVEHPDPAADDGHPLEG